MPEAISDATEAVTADLRCPSCGEPFTPKTRRQRYCTADCWPSKRATHAVRVTAEEVEALGGLSALIPLAKRLGVYRAREVEAR